LALFGYYDTDRDGGLSYYEFIEKVLESDFVSSENKNKPKQTAILAALPKEEDEVNLKSVLSDKAR